MNAKSEASLPAYVRILQNDTKRPRNKPLMTLSTVKHDKYKEISRYLI